MSINKALISGNLTRDAELRMTPNGTQVLTFSVAVNESRLNKQTGEYKQQPNYIGCTMFGKRAEALSHHLPKGTKVTVEGHLRYSSWEKDGERRSNVGIIVDDLEFMSRREDQQGDRAQAQESVAAAPELYDEDIPF